MQKGPSTLRYFPPSTTAVAPTAKPSTGFLFMAVKPTFLRSVDFVGACVDQATLPKYLRPRSAMAGSRRRFHTMKTEGTLNGGGVPCRSRLF